MIVSLLCLTDASIAFLSFPKGLGIKDCDVRTAAVIPVFYVLSLTSGLNSYSDLNEQMHNP